MSNRGEHAEIETFLGETVDSELSGNMIDICPVGALTSKPFRYNARTWELSRRKSVSPHDSTGANLIVQVKNHTARCAWCRSKTRRSTSVGLRTVTVSPMKSLEQRRALDGAHAQARRPVAGPWTGPRRLEYVANGLKQIKARVTAPDSARRCWPVHTCTSRRTVASSWHADARSRVQRQHRPPPASMPSSTSTTGSARYLGLLHCIALSTLKHASGGGQPLAQRPPAVFAQRIRQAARRGCESRCDWLRRASSTVANDWAIAGASPFLNWLAPKSGAQLLGQRGGRCGRR